MLEVNYEKIKQRSITSGLISILGILIFVSSLIYASINLKNSNKEISIQKTQIESLAILKNRLNDSVNQVRQQLANSRISSRFISIGITCFHNKDYSGAVEAYDKAIKLDSLNPIIFDLKGYSLYRNNKFAESIKSLRRSVKIDSTYSWGYYDLSLVLWASGFKSESVEVLQKLVRNDPSFKTIIKKDGQFNKIIESPVVKNILRE